MIEISEDGDRHGDEDGDEGGDSKTKYDDDENEN